MSIYNSYLWRQDDSEVEEGSYKCSIGMCPLPASCLMPGWFGCIVLYFERKSPRTFRKWRDLLVKVIFSIISWLWSDLRSEEELHASVVGAVVESWKLWGMQDSHICGYIFIIEAQFDFFWIIRLTKKFLLLPIISDFK